MDRIKTLQASINNLDALGKTTDAPTSQQLGKITQWLRLHALDILVGATVEKVENKPRRVMQYEHGKHGGRTSEAVAALELLLEKRSQADIARAIGVAPHCVCAWKNGGGMAQHNAEALIKLANEEE